MYPSCSSIFLSARNSFFLFDDKKINEAAEITFVRSHTEILNLNLNFRRVVFIITSGFWGPRR